MRSPWRLRVRAGLVLYVTVSLLFRGSLADLEHFWAVALALPLSRLLVGDRAVGGAGRFSVTRREWRLIVAAGLALIGAAEVVLWLSPRTACSAPAARRSRRGGTSPSTWPWSRWSSTGSGRDAGGRGGARPPWASSTWSVR